MTEFELEKMKEILQDPDVLTIGDAMRNKRNYDFYGGGALITDKEVEDYLRFVEGILAKVKERL